jgi:hypothetical protein
MQKVIIDFLSKENIVFNRLTIQVELSWLLISSGSVSDPEQELDPHWIFIRWPPGSGSSPVLV